MSQHVRVHEHTKLVFKLKKKKNFIKYNSTIRR